MFMSPISDVLLFLFSSTVMKLVTIIWGTDIHNCCITLCTAACSLTRCSSPLCPPVETLPGVASRPERQPLPGDGLCPRRRRQGRTRCACRSSPPAFPVSLRRSPQALRLLRRGFWEMSFSAGRSWSRDVLPRAPHPPPQRSTRLAGCSLLGDCAQRRAGDVLFPWPRSWRRREGTLARNVLCAPGSWPPEPPRSVRAWRRPARPRSLPPHGCGTVQTHRPGSLRPGPEAASLRGAQPRRAGAWCPRTVPPWGAKPLLGGRGGSSRETLHETARDGQQVPDSFVLGESGLSPLRKLTGP